MSIDGKLKKGDFVLIRKGVESNERGAIKFKGNVIGYIEEVKGEQAKVNIAFEDGDITLTYKLQDLERYKHS
jgi:hypothetical protein